MNQYIFIGDNHGTLFLLGFCMGDTPQEAWKILIDIEPKDYDGEIMWYKVGEHNSWWDSKSKY